MFDRVFSNIVGSIADFVAPAALIAPLWADLFGGSVSGRGTAVLHGQICNCATSRVVGHWCCRLAR